VNIYVVDVLFEYDASTSAYIGLTKEPSIVMPSPSKSFKGITIVFQQVYKVHLQQWL
jgi:hypothetical protein